MQPPILPARHSGFCCVYDENWQEADTALAAFREPGELRDLELRIRSCLIDLYS
ncbi:MAG: hypothetical protein V9H25_06810 [Candidatus Competibacter sp.]